MLEQMRVSVLLWILGESLVDLREIVIHLRAVVRHRTPRVDEGNEQRFALELVQVDGLAVLVRQLEIGNQISLRGHVVLNGRLVVGPALRSYNDLVETPGLHNRQPSFARVTSR